MAKPPRPLTERNIRDAVVLRLRDGARHQDLLIEELGVGSARVDLALVADSFSGYEIKSDFDTLDRLARQMHAYHSVFDTLTIITTATYANQVEALLPSWWGIWLAQEEKTDVVQLHEYRPAALHGRQDAASLAALLWRDEAYTFILDTLGPVIRARATRGDLQEIISREIPLDHIRKQVLHSLRERESLKPRSHRASQQLANGEYDMVVGRISSPCGQVAR